MKNAAASLHAVQLELIGAPSRPVPVGTEFELPVALACPAGCSLAGARVELVGPGGPLAAALAEARADGSAVATLATKAPSAAGVHSWRIELPPQQIDGCPHTAGPLPFEVATRMHRISVTAWNVPSPATAGSPLAFRVGAKCLDGCRLGGKHVEVRDGEVSVAVGTLGDEPLPGTSDLYWTELETLAPEEEGSVAWQAHVAPGELPLPHAEGLAPLRLRTVLPGEHSVKLRVVSGEGGEPVAGAMLRIGPYRGMTDEQGVAAIQVSRGQHKLAVWMPGFKPLERVIAIAGAQELEIVVEPIPEEDPYAAWQM